MTVIIYNYITYTFLENPTDHILNNNVSLCTEKWIPSISSLLRWFYSFILTRPILYKLGQSKFLSFIFYPCLKMKLFIMTFSVKTTTPFCLVILWTYTILRLVVSIINSHWFLETNRSIRNHFKSLRTMINNNNYTSKFGLGETLWFTVTPT